MKKIVIIISGEFEWKYEQTGEHLENYHLATGVCKDCDKELNRQELQCEYDEKNETYEATGSGYHYVWNTCEKCEKRAVVYTPNCSGGTPVGETGMWYCEFCGDIYTP